MSDTSKTIRSFQCRDALWERFEQMARELECSVDYLLNDAMKQYARQRSANVPPSRTSLNPPAPPTSSVAAPPPPPAGYGYASQVSVAPPTVARPRPAPPPPPAPAPYQGTNGHSVSGVAGASVSGVAGVTGMPSVAPPRRPSRVAPPSPPGMAGGRPQLNAYYMGERFPINKDRFIIGRGKQSSDLTIKDPNVSRQHAMVEYLDGHYYIVDMGSTNGVEHAGQRVKRHLVNEGDTFRVCDHELRFSFH